MARTLSEQVGRAIRKSMADSVTLSQVDASTHAQIAQRAYGRGEEAGSAEGAAELNWLEAKQELAGTLLRHARITLTTAATSVAHSS